MLIQELSKDAKALLDEKENHMNKKSTIIFDLYKVRQLGESAELKAQDRRRRMELLRTRQEVLNTISESFGKKEQDFLEEDLLLTRKWKDDDQRLREERLRLNHETKERIEKLTHSEIKDDLKRRIDELERARQRKLLEIENVRNERIRISNSYPNAISPKLSTSVIDSE